MEMIAWYLGIQLNGPLVPSKGFQVIGVDSRSPAAKSKETKILPGEYIGSIDGVVPKTKEEALALMQKSPEGLLALEINSADGTATYKYKYQMEAVIWYLGIDFENTPVKDKGFQVIAVEPRSPATKNKDTQILPGEYIYSVNGIVPKTKAEALSLIQLSGLGEVILEINSADGATKYKYNYKMEKR